ncbi:MAG TPA: glycosyltransferase, partial [Verrucomicrobiae bacterium]|nr:glycosyltransferase [Verrucomicrobiae bacterium]
PALAACGDEVLVLAREAADPQAYAVPCEVVPWSDEHDPPDAAAGERVAALARAFAPEAAVAHNVLDSRVLAAARANAPRFVYHLHDHRPFCPNGDRLYPQGGSVCELAMSVPVCGAHALLRGCAYGPRPRTLALVRTREAVAREVRAADCTIALSRYVAALAARNGVARDRVRVVAPPLASEAFAAAPVARPAGDTILFAGRVMPSKGARSLVRALSLLAPAPLLRVAGSGPDLAATLDEARRRGIAAQALGRLDAAGLRRALDDATLLALPSLWAEPYGLIGIEAFARGRPVAAYQSGGIPEWLGDAGASAPRGNEAALARAIAELLAPQTWMRAATAAFAAAQSYRVEARVQELRTLYGMRRT